MKEFDSCTTAGLGFGNLKAGTEQENFGKHSLVLLIYLYPEIAGEAAAPSH